MSNKDTLPELEPERTKPALMKKQSSVLSESAAGKDKPGREARSESDPVFTGQPEKRNLAVKQIKETFERSKMIKVGAPKIEASGRVMKGVTAVSVKDLLPMKQAELLKMALVVNDDDLDKQTMDAASGRGEGQCQWAQSPCDLHFLST